MDLAQFAMVKDYVDFDADSEAALRAFHAVAEPHFASIVDDFYRRVEEVPMARGLITGGKQQIQRLKLTLREWLDVLLKGPYDESYLETRSRIGRVHVRIGMAQELMFTAMNRVRSRLQDVALTTYGNEPETCRRVLRAVGQILDIELAIMLDTYREYLIDKMRASERLATIGQLAGSIGHELRNPLSTIDSSVFLLQARMNRLDIDDAQLHKHHQKIAAQVKHCGKIIDNLLDLARDRPPKRRRAPVSELVHKAIELAALPPEVQVLFQSQENDIVDADIDDLSLVVANLLTNASQAQGWQGSIRVSTERDKGGTVIRVSDSGPGVPIELRHRIFDALFTTRARGTGLGLALCRRILYAHGGEIDLEPSGPGATFRVWVPDRAPTGSEEPAPSAAG